jgi:hypothetical protein
MRLNGLADRVDGQEYPATTDEIVAEIGDVEVELARGSERVGAVLRRDGAETYDCPEDVKGALRSCVAARAVGRRFYSDRDQFTPGERGRPPVSF